VGDRKVLEGQKRSIRAKMEEMKSLTGSYAKTARKLPIKEDHTSRLHGVTT
jgi:hypothetical protein